MVVNSSGGNSVSHAHDDRVGTSLAATASILIVDDESSVRDGLAEWFRQEAWNIETAADADEALRKMGQRSFHVALLDIRLPGMDGLQLQKRLRAIDPNLTIILMTAFASVNTAVQAMKEGAYDYITKPFQPDEFTQVIRHALEDHALLKPALPEGPVILAHSDGMVKVLEMIGSVATSDATVILQGASGTGKELLARRIHALSPRRGFNFVPVNCGGLSESLLESELFGHEKGAFTGAQFRRKGKIELAHGGTLFLDEIGEIPPKMQVDLLRVLEDRQITRLGADFPMSVDFRVVAATNRDLHEMVRKGLFREDLFYRLNVIKIDIPPLRERRTDIPVLVDYFIDSCSRAVKKSARSLSPAALARLVAYDWPGNVRELRNVIERAVILGNGPVLEAQDLLFPEEKAKSSLETISDVERAHIVTILEETGGNIARAARRLGIDRTTLYRKLERYGLRRSGQGSDG